ncbi:MAG: YbaB/EbfC family nucleoid-associated protein [Spirochaetia bacterium]|nr:YbaB/EbfC family nucleoid-associated protein [Spirochaetia bacterium]
MDFSELFKNIGGMKEQVEMMRQRVARLQVTGEAGAGMVKVTQSGEGHVTDIKIDPELLAKDQKDMLEELLISATNDAMKKTKEAVAHELKSVAGGLNIPGLEKLFGM